MPLTPQQLAELQRLREMFQPLAAESQRKAKAIENLESVAGPVKLPMDRKAQGGTIEPDQDTMRLALTKHGMYSPLEKAAINVPRTKGTAAEFMTEASKQPGFRQEEVADRKIQFPEGKLTKQQFVEHLKKNSLPPLQEKVLKDYGDSWEGGYDKAAQELYRTNYDDLDAPEQKRVRDHWQQSGTHYSEYQMPGGTNYREMLLKLPERKPNPEKYKDPEAYDRDMRAFNASGQDDYQSSHWRDHPNVLAHLRLSDRKGPNNEKLLHVEEIQSDWHQEGRKKGYRDEQQKTAWNNPEYVQVRNRATDLLNEFNRNNHRPDRQAEIEPMLREAQRAERAIVDRNNQIGQLVPEAPFKKSWHEMALKHVLHHAAKNGYQGIVITPGEEQADRYDMSKQVKRLVWHPETSTLAAERHEGGDSLKYENVTANKLPDYIGKEAAEKIMNVTPISGWHMLLGDDLKIGGSGMKGFYDKIVPDYLNKLGKKHGVKVSKMPITVPPRDSSFTFGYPGAEDYVGGRSTWSEFLARNPKAAQEFSSPVHHFPITEPMRQSILKEGLPQYQRGGIIHKAQGGAVLSTEQMRAELMNKTRFKGLSDLQSIGANEAPSLNIKAFVPPVGRADNNEMPVGGIDMDDLQLGHQLMPGQQQGQPGQPPAPPGAPQAQPGQPPMGAMPPQAPPQAPQGAQSSILQLTPQGQAMAALGGNQPQQPKMAKGGKVEVKPTVFDDKASRRHPDIETAIKAFQAGIIDQKEYDRIVQKHKPVKAYDFVPAPATDEDAMRALKNTQKEKWRSHQEWPEGHPVGLRLDIPAYENHGVWVNSVHDEQGGDQKFPTSYGPVSSVKNAVFEGKPEKAVRVASGDQSKAPFARIKGELHHMTEDEAVAHMVKHLKHKDWRQVGYDPRRHGDFYDRETMQPVTHAEHVIQIGPLVLAKKPKYGKRTMYATGGSTKGYVPHTPQKPHPEVGNRFTAIPQGNLVKRKNLNLEKYENKGSIVGIPYDATTRDNLVSEISGHQLTNPLLTEAGFDYSMAPEHVKQGIGGASNLGIAGRVQNRVNQAYNEHGGDVFLAPTTMSDSPLVKDYPENFSHHPAHIILDLLKQRQLNPKIIKMLNDDLRGQAEIKRNVRTGKTEKVFPYVNFLGYEHPNMMEQVMKGGHGLGATAGDLRKKIVERLGQVNVQKLLDYNIGDVRGGILDPDIATDPKGFTGRNFIKAKPNAPLTLSKHSSYDTDYGGKYAGGFGKNRPIEIVTPDIFEKIEQEIKNIPANKNKSKASIRAQVIGAMEKRKEGVAQPINARVINNAGMYEEGLRNGEFDPKNLESVLAYFKRKGGYKAGGKVKLSKDMDIINLELSKSRKKAK